jgi:hypothetical protein
MLQAKSLLHAIQLAPSSSRRYLEMRARRLLSGPSASSNPSRMHSLTHSAFVTDGRFAEAWRGLPDWQSASASAS